MSIARLMKIDSKKFRVREGETVKLNGKTSASQRRAPWFVVPADDKENARLIISQIVLDTLKNLRLKFPEATEERRKGLQAIRKSLAK
jgi:Polyphosphate kinase 2 (PPK2)